MIEYSYRGKEYKADDKYEKIVEAACELQTAKDLKREHLTLAEYYCVMGMLHELFQTGTTKTCHESVAEWFERQGCTVSPDEHKVNYIIKY